MQHWNHYLYQTALNGLYYTGMHRLLSSATSGAGLIFTLHQVSAEPVAEFSPNSILKVTPDFLEETILAVLASGYEIISLDEMKQRLLGQASGAPFAVFTFDDGYRDNRDVALKIFEKYNIPLSIYIVSEYSSHQGELWWVVLEEVIRNRDVVVDPFDGSVRYPAGTVKQKYQVFDLLYWRLRPMDQVEQRVVIRRLADDHEFDIQALTKDLIMDWDELRDIAKHPLVTLAAHTKNHFSISTLELDDAREEILAGVRRMEEELGERPAHFSYPYGDVSCAGPRDFALATELGFDTAVTTRKGVLYEGHKEHLTALPRVSLNGEYQKRRYVETYISGLPFMIKNGFKELDVL